MQQPAFPSPRLFLVVAALVLAASCGNNVNNNGFFVSAAAGAPKITLDCGTLGSTGGVVSGTYPSGVVIDACCALPQGLTVTDYYGPNLTLVANNSVSCDNQIVTVKDSLFDASVWDGYSYFPGGFIEVWKTSGSLNNVSWLFSNVTGKLLDNDPTDTAASVFSLVHMRPPLRGPEDNTSTIVVRDCDVTFSFSNQLQGTSSISLFRFAGNSVTSHRTISFVNNSLFVDVQQNSKLGLDVSFVQTTAEAVWDRVANIRFESNRFWAPAPTTSTQSCSPGKVLQCTGTGLGVVGGGSTFVFMFGFYGTSMSPPGIGLSSLTMVDNYMNFSSIISNVAGSPPAVGGVAAGLFYTAGAIMWDMWHLKNMPPGGNAAAVNISGNNVHLRAQSMDSQARVQLALFGNAMSKLGWVLAEYNTVHLTALGGDSLAKPSTVSLLHIVRGGGGFSLSASNNRILNMYNNNNKGPAHVSLIASPGSLSNMMSMIASNNTFDGPVFALAGSTKGHAEFSLIHAIGAIVGLPTDKSFDGVTPPRLVIDGNSISSGVELLAPSKVNAVLQLLITGADASNWYISCSRNVITNAVLRSGATADISLMYFTNGLSLPQIDVIGNNISAGILLEAAQSSNIQLINGQGIVYTAAGTCIVTISDNTVADAVVSAIATSTVVGTGVWGFHLTKSAVGIQQLLCMRNTLARLNITQVAPSPIISGSIIMLVYSANTYGDGAATGYFPHELLISHNSISDCYLLGTYSFVTAVQFARGAAFRGGNHVGVNIHSNSMSSCTLTSPLVDPTATVFGMVGAVWLYVDNGAFEGNVTVSNNLIDRSSFTSSKDCTGTGVCFSVIRVVEFAPKSTAVTTDVFYVENNTVANNVLTSPTGSSANPAELVFFKCNPKLNNKYPNRLGSLSISSNTARNNTLYGQKDGSYLMGANFHGMIGGDLPAIARRPWSFNNNTFSQNELGTSMGGGYLGVSVATFSDDLRDTDSITADNNVIETTHSRFGGRSMGYTRIISLWGGNNSLVLSIRASNNVLRNVSTASMQQAADISVLWVYQKLEFVSSIDLSGNSIADVLVWQRGSAGTTVGGTFVSILSSPGTLAYSSSIVIANNNISDAKTLNTAATQSYVAVFSSQSIKPLTALPSVLLTGNTLRNIELTLDNTASPDVDLAIAHVLAAAPINNIASLRVTDSSSSGTLKFSRGGSAGPAARVTGIACVVCSTQGDVGGAGTSISVDNVSLTGVIFDGSTDLHCNKTRAAMISAPNGNIVLGPRATHNITVTRSRLSSSNADSSAFVSTDRALTTSSPVNTEPPPFAITVDSCSIELVSQPGTVPQPAQISAVLARNAESPGNITVKVSRTSVVYDSSLAAPIGGGGGGIAAPVVVTAADFASTPPRIEVEQVSVDVVEPNVNAGNVSAALVSVYRNNDSSVCNPGVFGADAIAALNDTSIPTAPSSTDPIVIIANDSTVSSGENTSAPPGSSSSSTGGGGGACVSMLYAHRGAETTPVSTLSFENIKLATSRPRIFQCTPDNSLYQPVVSGSTWTVRCGRWTKAFQRRINTELVSRGATVLNPQLPGVAGCFGTDSATHSETASHFTVTLSGRKSTTRSQLETQSDLQTHTGEKATASRTKSITVLPPPTTTTISCANGQYHNGTGCALCPVDTYSVTANSTSCMPCPNGTTTNNMTGVSACVATTTTATTTTTTTITTTTTTEVPATTTSTASAATTTTATTTTESPFVNVTTFAPETVLSAPVVEGSSGAAGGLAFIGAIAMSPAAPYVAARSLSVLYLSSCQLQDKAQTFPVNIMPFNILFGPKEGQYYRSTIVVNTIFLVILSAVVLILGAIMSKISPGSVATEPRGIFWKAATAIFWPSSAVLWGGVAYDGILSSGTALISMAVQNNQLDHLAIDAPMCIGGILVVVVPICVVFYNIHKMVYTDSTLIYAPTEVVVHRSGAPACVRKVVSGGAGRFACFGYNAWVSSQLGVPIPAAARRHRMGYWPVRMKRPNEGRVGYLAPHWVFVEAIFAILVSLARGVRIDCVPILYAIAALCIVYALLVVYLRPQKVPLKNVMACVASICTAGAAITIAVSQQHEDRTLRATGERMALISAFLSLFPVPLLCARFLLQKCFKITQERQQADRKDLAELEAAIFAALDDETNQYDDIGSGGDIAMKETSAAAAVPAPQEQQQDHVGSALVTSPSTSMGVVDVPPAAGQQDAEVLPLEEEDIL